MVLHSDIRTSRQPQNYGRHDPFWRGRTRPVIKPFANVSSENCAALRVKLQATAVVAGEIFHRSLSMDEHAQFEGCSRPEDNPPEPRSYIKAESANPQSQPRSLVAFAPDGQSALNLAAARTTPYPGTAWSTKRYLNIEPSPLEPVPDAAQPKSKVRKNSGHYHSQ